MCKNLLITGASSDIGIELLKSIKDEYDVILAHYNQSDCELQKLKKNWTGRSCLKLLKADFSDQAGVGDFIAQIRKLGDSPNHIVHLPAAKVFYKKFHKCNWEDYETGMNVSLGSIVRILQEFLPEMSRERYGKVIFMLTSCTLNMPPKYQSPYVAVKYALLGLMKSLSVEYANKGIMINGVSPDMIETKFLSEVPQLIVEKNAENSPLGRNLTEKDVVPAIQYLLSDAADAVTGQNLGITGGCMIGG